MNDALRFILTDPAQARLAMTGQLAPYCRNKWASGVERLVVTVEPEEDAKTVQQGRFYWGVVLKETSEQARIEGVQYSSQAWHELFKRLHLPARKKKTRVAGRKRMVVTTTIGTTVGIGVRRMSVYIEKCMAQAQVDFGVRFSELMPQELKPAPAKPRKTAAQLADPDTGEIMEGAAA